MDYIISKETKDPNYKCGAPFHGDKIFISIMLDTLKKAERNRDKNMQHKFNSYLNNMNTTMSSFQ